MSETKVSRGTKTLPNHMMASLKSWGEADEWFQQNGRTNITVDCGWGRLIFGQTFDAPERLAEYLQKEVKGRRDIAFYVREPHVVLAAAPLALFLDPSNTFRLDLTRQLPSAGDAGLLIRPAELSDLGAINSIFSARGMISWLEAFMAEAVEREDLTLLVAQEAPAGNVVGVVEGVDHVAVFDDPDNGSSLWSLAVDTKARSPGIGRKLSLALADHFRNKGRAFMDLSVMHDNESAIDLYRKLGFEQVPVYCVKRKNTVNERLFTGPEPDYDLNIYAQIIVDEARRRGITVEIEDAAAGLFDLTLGARTVSCRESLSDLVSAVAMSRCADKALTHRLLSGAGLKVPAQQIVHNEDEAVAFLEQYNRIVIKPVQGEQGQGVFVDLKSAKSVRSAFERAQQFSGGVIAEQFVAGEDVRIIVIDTEVVAAAVRQPASVMGDGVLTVRALIEKQSRRREAATRGESSIPIDEETARCVSHSGYELDGVLEDGQVLAVRKTANLHTGGTIRDVTSSLNPSLAAAAQEAAMTLDMPVVGLDFIVPAIDQPAYWIIEANERPGLANHEPAPTVEKFVDFLFPSTRN